MYIYIWAFYDVYIYKVGRPLSRTTRKLPFQLLRYQRVWVGVTPFTRWPHLHLTWVLSREASSTIFLVVGMTQPGIELRFSGPLASTLIIMLTGVDWKVRRLNNILWWNVTKWGLFFNLVPRMTHTLRPSMLLCLNPIFQKINRKYNVTEREREREFGLVWFGFFV